MKRKIVTRIGSILISAVLMAGSVPVYSQEPETSYGMEMSQDGDNSSVENIGFSQDLSPVDNAATGGELSINSEENLNKQDPQNNQNSQGEQEYQGNHGTQGNQCNQDYQNNQNEQDFQGAQNNQDTQDNQDNHGNLDQEEAASCSEQEEEEPSDSEAEPVAPEPELKITLEDNMAIVEASDYELPENWKSLKVALWSNDKGQDDLKWYKLTKISELAGSTESSDSPESTGAFESSEKDRFQVKIDLLNHGSKDDLFHFHLYCVTTDGKMVFLDAQNLTTENVFSTKVTASEEEDGFVLTLHKPSVQPKKVEFAIWSAEGGQDDLRWCTATYNATEKKAVLHWKPTSLKHSGRVFVHCYLTDSTGKKHFQGSTELMLAAPGIESIQASIDNTSGSFQVTLSGISTSSCIRSILVPIWSDSKQKDIRWYDARKNSDGSWGLTSNISFHDYREGRYQVHVYITDIWGIQRFVGATSFQCDPVKMPSKTEEQISSDGICQIRAINYRALETGKNARVAFWSAENGQDDLRWYSLSKKEESTEEGTSIVRYASIDLKKHGAVNGTYYAHVYYDGADGKPHCVSAYSFQVKDLFQTSLTAQKTDTGYRFILTNPTVSSGKVRFAIWSAEGGQDDLKWFDGTWNGTTREAQLNWNPSHLKHFGQVLVHVYGVDQKGNYVFQKNTTVELAEEFNTVVDSQEKATFLITGYKNAKQVLVYVWSNNGGQDDLRCYQAKPTANGWTASVQKTDHGSAGYYTAHLYVDGVYRDKDSFSFDEGRNADSWHSISSAHGAGGQGPDKLDIYTNCISAMNNSYQTGYRTFEIDVILTSDGEPVLYHTWKTDILDHYSYSAATAAGPSYQEFMSDTMYNGQYRTSDFKDLLRFLMAHPDTKVLLDTKYRSENDIRSLYRKLLSVADSMGASASLKNQVIPYLFDTSHLSAIQSVCGFREYHFATYATFKKTGGTIDAAKFRSLLQFCRMNRILSISVWDSLATKNLIQMADSFGIETYVHTTDDPETAQRLLRLGAAGIISNTIDPVQAIGMIS
ncbi:MAG: GBS Bsp-like repeat-containing protein [Lachnospiraceae bacterium]|nr:GBS Bsp-like repeat-containing protein [Lachnospiraceae bacterium]